jgi:hypothetical protein
MTRRLWPKGSKGRKSSGLVFTRRQRRLRKQRKQMGGNLLYRELPKKAEGAVDVKPMDWDT